MTLTEKQTAFDALGLRVEWLPKEPLKITLPISYRDEAKLS